MHLDRYRDEDISKCDPDSIDGCPLDSASPKAQSETQSFSALGMIAALATALSACGGGGGGTLTSPPPPPPPPVITKAQAARFLLQAQFSAPDADINAVISQGFSAWLSGQYAAAPGQTATAWLTSRGFNTIDATSQNFFRSALADIAAWNQLITATDGLRKRLSLALSEMMVVSTNGVASEVWPGYLMTNYWDMLNANVFGNFRTLLEAVTLNPAMGYYLNAKGNLKEDGKGREPDENYAREVMQLFTIGLYEINDDGSVKTDLTGKKIETYTQTEITSLAHVFTGWDLDFTGTTRTPVVLQGKTQNIPDPTYTGLPMVNTAANHSTLAVTFLGTTIPANTSAATSLKTALDTLFNHHNVGPFFARQMIQRLVTSNPSPAYISRVTAVFNNNGVGVRGDLKSVWTAILTDAEATAVPTSSTAGKLREPMIRLVQLSRIFGATSTSGNWPIPDLSDTATEIAQSPWRAPNVFNFFRPGYVPPGTALAIQNLVGPEFQLVDETAVSGYLNYIANYLKSGIGGDVKLDYTALTSLIPDTQAIIDYVNLHMAANQLTATTQATIKTALDAQNVTAASTATQKADLASLAIYLAMATTDYLVQK